MNPSPTRRTPRRALRWLLAVVLLALLAAGATYAWKQRAAAAATAARPTATVAIGDLEQTVTAVGSLKAKEYVDVGTQVSGRVERIHVQIGQKVEKGALIAEIDPTVYASTVRKDQATLDNLRAQLAQRRAELALSRQQLGRNQRLAAEQAVSQDSLQTAAASASVAAATVTAIEAQIKAAEATLAGNVANLGYTKIYAPMAGTVVVQDTRAGQTVNSTQSVAVIAQIADLDTMTVWAQVAEADVGKIVPGMPAYFTTLGDPERRWRGTVRQVQPTPTTTNDVVLYYALIDVANPDQRLLPAMTVQAFFVQAEARQVPVVPLTALEKAPRRERGAAVANSAGDGSSAARPALTERAAPSSDATPAIATTGGERRRRSGEGSARGERGSRWLATVLTPQGTTERREVVTGVVTRTAAEVKSGLAVGDKVLLPEVAASDTPAAGGAQRQRGRMPAMGPRL